MFDTEAEFGFAGRPASQTSTKLAGQPFEDILYWSVATLGIYDR